MQSVEATINGAPGKIGGTCGMKGIYKSARLCGLVLAFATTADAVGARVVEERSGYDLWGMRPRHVAVVNPVLGEDSQWTLSLDGTWDFCAHENRAERNASWGAMFAHEDNWGEVRKIRVPGWATAFSAGGTSAAAGAKCVDVRVPAGRSELALAMKAEAKFTPWAKPRGLSVDRGPLTYSVAIGERYSQVTAVKGKSGSTTWTEVTDQDARKTLVYTGIAPTTPWSWTTLTSPSRSRTSGCLTCTANAANSKMP